MADNGILRQCGLKNTPHRDRILCILRACDRPMAAEDVYFAVSPKGKIALSTVYRCMNALCEKGILQKSVNSETGKTLYEVADGSHRHYITCTCCKRREELRDCPFDGLENKISSETGFTLQTHQLELYGLCPACRGEGGQDNSCKEEMENRKGE